MNTQIILIIGFGLVTAMAFLIGIGKLEWAAKGKNPGGDRDKKVRGFSRKVSYFCFSMMLFQVYLYFHDKGLT